MLNSTQITPTQMHLLKLFSFDRSESSALEIKEVLMRHFQDCLDTNSLIQCVSRRSRNHELWLSLSDGRNELCVTTEILNE